MVKQQHITDCHKHCPKAVHCKQLSQSWYVAKIGKHINEYTDMLLASGMATFLFQGNKLFQGAGKWDANWQMQQDNAPPLKTATNMVFITTDVPGGRFLI